MFRLHATPDPVSRQSLSFGGQALFTAIGCWVKPNAGLIGSEDENSQHRFCHEPAPPRAPPARADLRPHGPIAGPDALFQSGAGAGVVEVSAVEVDGPGAATGDVADLFTTGLHGPA